ncbi:sodium:proton antiporter [Ureibacillus massiliensis 4400831 = CIP 108448 = CCUG 49529]|uniref:Sodium:proton antiporter n=1 Tax=Ureibacillus massiliensis 4400831 = CIP 108448 = CCUG 49529 TaxID=1211035 RepID=A0A0A3J4V6_9BACL|nr:Na+/H+ antiporter NhaC family protein [Ureibacillus massiliensis]KGR91971.1 sodium:proton antiporter [Ureibacillus massiliensis 4400831 = CIP 108448 = CCUG 49529]
MNAVIVAVVVMLVLSLIRVNVVLSLVIGGVIGGLAGGLSIADTINAFNGGLGNGAEVALSYGLLGSFAVAISKTGITELLINKILGLVNKNGESNKKGLVKALIFIFLFLMAIFSQNLIPIHIAFIPLLVPPILKILNMLEIDRRLIACILTFGLITPYIFLPYGFGFIYQDLVAKQIGLAGLEIQMSDIPMAMALPALGMLVGLLLAFFVYRKPRKYNNNNEVSEEKFEVTITARNILFTIVALIVSVLVQISTDSMIIAALSGILVLYVTGALKWNDADVILSEGMRMMAFIGFVIISANGFSEVIKATGHVESLVENTLAILNGNMSLAVLLMLIIGLVVTMGIGSSFATIPIIAAIFVPLSLELGLSPLAIIALIGTAGALGDAGSPASDSTLGPTSGLNADGQHNHIWDSCVPTFIFYNIPLIIFGWIAIMFVL